MLTIPEQNTIACYKLNTKYLILLKAVSLSKLKRAESSLTTVRSVKDHCFTSNTVQGSSESSFGASSSCPRPVADPFFLH